MSFLLPLIIGAAMTAIAGGACSLKAASIKNKRSELIDMLEPCIGAKPDNIAGDAMTLSLLNQEDARIAAKDAAAGLGILSAVLSLGASLLAG